MTELYLKFSLYCTDYVFCAVWTEIWNIIQVNLKVFEGLIVTDKNIISTINFKWCVLLVKQKFTLAFC